MDRSLGDAGGKLAIGDRDVTLVDGRRIAALLRMVEGRVAQILKYPCH